MQFADRSDLVPGLCQAVVAARHAAVIRDRVVPEPDAVDVTPGRQRGARRHADRRVAIGVAEVHSFRSEAVEQDLAADCEAELRRVVDPDAADALAKADQGARVAAMGGREAVIARGSFGYSPTPGTTPVYN